MLQSVLDKMLLRNKLPRPQNVKIMVQIFETKTLMQNLSYKEQLLFSAIVTRKTTSVCVTVKVK